jgi:hypothetical protein
MLHLQLSPVVLQGKCADALTACHLGQHNRHQKQLQQQQQQQQQQWLGLTSKLAKVICSGMGA